LSLDFLFVSTNYLFILDFSPNGIEVPNRTFSFAIFLSLRPLDVIACLKSTYLYSFI